MMKELRRDVWGTIAQTNSADGVLKNTSSGEEKDTNDQPRGFLLRVGVGLGLGEEVGLGLAVGVGLGVGLGLGVGVGL